MKQEIFIVEEFLPDPDVVLETIKRVGYNVHNFEGNKRDYTGWGEATLPIKALLEQAVGFSINIVMSHLRLGNQTNKLTHYIHADTAGAAYAMVLFLSDVPYMTGTAFWKHKETGLERQPFPTPPELFAKLDNDIEHEEKWDMTGLVRAKKNRAVIFASDLFHCRYPKDLPEESNTTPRLVNTVFFNRA